MAQTLFKWLRKSSTVQPALYPLATDVSTTRAAHHVTIVKQRSSWPRRTSGNGRLGLRLIAICLTTYEKRFSLIFGSARKHESQIFQRQEIRMFVHNKPLIYKIQEFPHNHVCTFLKNEVTILQSLYTLLYCPNWFSSKFPSNSQGFKPTVFSAGGKERFYTADHEESQKRMLFVHNEAAWEPCPSNENYFVSSGWTYSILIALPVDCLQVKLGI